MTLTIAPEPETRLLERAARDGKDVYRVGQDLLADALIDPPADREDTLTDEEIAAAQHRERPLSAYVSDLQKRRAQRANHP